MIPLTEDIETLTARYLSALKSNSDEIARLADALRAAEAEGVRYLNERDEARNLLAERVIAHRHVEAERNTATTELITARLALLNAEACRAEAERQMHAAEAMKSRLAQQRLEAEERTEKALEQRDAARADLDEARHILKCPDNMTLWDWCQHLADDLAASETIRADAAERDRDAARADAKALAQSLQYLSENNTDFAHEIANAALIAHWAATGKAVTR